ncbi:sigma-70 family RNA polymerase sigma factor [Rossellomorea aquimaris]|uniref:sigma-70 family RNA polymerase sigma factor n=1 Tax=Rossellomorea aquimaris TaxID=189382 RepID=UPI000A788F4F
MIQSLHIYKNQQEFYQIGLIALWEANKKYDPTKGAFPPYAYSYIKGRMLTEMTKSNQHEERNIYMKEDFWELIEEEKPASILPNELVLSYCKELTENQTKWVLYTCLQMLTICEIAEVENVSVSAVKKWRAGAKEKLKRSGILEIV